MPIRSNYALTPAQRETLTDLLEAGCVSRESALSALELRRVNPNVVGILIDKGWALKRTRSTPGGARAASYWLTREGVAKAQEVNLGH
jgi:hypothetical protein